MKKVYKVEVDCANCANKMENAAKNTEGVKSLSISFMTQKMTVEFEDGADVLAVAKEIAKKCKRIDSDFSMKG